MYQERLENEMNLALLDLEETDKEYDKLTIDSKREELNNLAQKRRFICERIQIMEKEMKLNENSMCKQEKMVISKALNSNGMFCRIIKFSK